MKYLTNCFAYVQPVTWFLHAVHKTSYQYLHKHGPKFGAWEYVYSKFKMCCCLAGLHQPLWNKSENEVIRELCFSVIIGRTRTVVS